MCCWAHLECKVCIMQHKTPFNKWLFDKPSQDHSWPPQRQEFRALQGQTNFDGASVVYSVKNVTSSFPIDPEPCIISLCSS